jgi:hypothetical protein
MPGRDNSEIEILKTFPLSFQSHKHPPGIAQCLERGGIWTIC